MFAHLFACEEPASPAYGYSDVKEHEAGYDSFMTGVCFLGLVKKLNINNSDISSKCPQLRPLLNKYVQYLLFSLKTCLNNL